MFSTAFGLTIVSVTEMEQKIVNKIKGELPWTRMQKERVNKNKTIGNFYKEVCKKN